MDTDAFSLYFGHIEDKRQSFKIQYPLCDILFLTVYATIAGAEGWQDIEDYGNGHVEWFQHQGLFRAGIPGHDTIARTIACIEPRQFQQCFLHWMQAVTLLTEGSLIAIDGKTLRASYNREDRCSAIHMVSAFAATNKVVLGQLKTDSKSNEITAIPALLSLLDIKGCLVSIDAMGCQKTIAAQIVEQGGDHLLAVKNNQPTLAKAVAQVLSGITVDQSKTKNAHFEKGHGRIEAREYHVLPAQNLVSQCPQWNGLKSLGVAVGYRIDKSGKELREYRYYISSALLSQEQFKNAVRGHWQIENSLHWVLDVTMNEDACQIYRKNAAENMACVRHIALNTLQQEKSKLSIRRKQKKAWMNPNFAMQVLKAGFEPVNEK